MLICHHCHKTLTLPEGWTHTVVCPHCRAEIDPTAPFQPDIGIQTDTPITAVPGPHDPGTSPIQWSTVARSTNMAEMGYLAHQLECRGYEVRIEQHDSFSALDGSWTSLYLLQVPAGDAEPSAHAIQEQLSLDETDSDVDSLLAGELAPEVPDDGLGTPAFWRPVALIVFAGVALLFVGHRMRELRGPDANPPHSPSLLRALEKIDQPFVSQPSPSNSKRYRITFDRHQHRWYLDTDIDGDGVYDQHHTFR
ncbi:MAG: hypothetical protein JW829_03505 [Pirellulales bacterium]|nr:hypothetical protein [Pirellulales bacterium]